MAPTASLDGGWELRPAVEADIDALMGWFGDARDVHTWGGPAFRYPFTPASFREDCHWPSMASFILQDPAGRGCGFGQVYEYRRRNHLARLVARPGARGRGVGRRLVEGLVSAGHALFSHPECSLFVFRDNAAALACYRAAGFSEADFPDDRAGFRDACYFLTRPVMLPPAASR